MGAKTAEGSGESRRPLSLRDIVVNPDNLSARGDGQAPAFFSLGDMTQQKPAYHAPFDPEEATAMRARLLSSADIPNSSNDAQRASQNNPQTEQSKYLKMYRWYVPKDSDKDELIPLLGIEQFRVLNPKEGIELLPITFWNGIYRMIDLKTGEIKYFNKRTWVDEYGDSNSQMVEDGDWGWKLRDPHELRVGSIVFPSNGDSWRVAVLDEKCAYTLTNGRVLRMLRASLPQEVICSEKIIAYSQMHLLRSYAKAGNPSGISLLVEEALNPTRP